MSIIDILLYKTTLTAIIAFTLLSIAIEIVGWKFQLLVQDISFNMWLLERIFIPLARAISLMIFILLCYPLLFGITVAPPLNSLLLEGSHRINVLMNVLFVLPLLFSIIPVLGKMPALLLPIQGIAGSTLVFSWMQAALPSAHAIHFIPDFSILALMFIMAFVSHQFAKWVSTSVAEYVDQRFEITDSNKIIYRIAIVITQLPVILIYTQGLGTQLSG